MCSRLLGDNGACVRVCVFACASNIFFFLNHVLIFKKIIVLLPCSLFVCFLRLDGSFATFLIIANGAVVKTFFVFVFLIRNYDFSLHKLAKVAIVCYVIRRLPTGRFRPSASVTALHCWCLSADL